MREILPTRDGAHRFTGPNRRRLAVIAGCLVLAIATAMLWAARDKSFDWPLFLSTIAALDWGWLSLGVACAYGTYLIRALRWAVLLRPLRPHPRMGKLISATVIGFSAVTALGRPAEMVRPYLIANAEGVPFVSQVAAWIVERIYDVLIALVVFGFALTQAEGAAEYVGPALSWTLRVGGWAIGVGASVCLALLLAMKYRSEQIRGWLMRMARLLRASHCERVERAVCGFADGAKCANSVSGTVQMVGYTLAEWLLVVACYGCVLRAFGSAAELGPVDVLVLMGFVSFGSLVQLPAVGGGAQVTAMLVLTEIFGVPLEVATSVALLLWFVSFVSIVPVGVWLAVREGLTWARLREAERGAV